MLHDRLRSWFSHKSWAFALLLTTVASSQKLATVLVSLRQEETHSFSKWEYCVRWVSTTGQHTVPIVARDFLATRMMAIANFCPYLQYVGACHPWDLSFSSGNPWSKSLNENNPQWIWQSASTSTPDRPTNQPTWLNWWIQHQLTMLVNGWTTNQPILPRASHALASVAAVDQAPGREICEELIRSPEQRCSCGVDHSAGDGWWMDG